MTEHAARSAASRHASREDARPFAPSEEEVARKAREAAIEPLTSAARRKQESRRKLLRAARKLFVERGFHQTRPQDISKLAGVGHGTFYLHFADKLDCFLAFATEAVDELDAMIADRVGVEADLEIVIAKVIRAITDYASANPGVLAAAMTDVAFLVPQESSAQLPAERWTGQWARAIDFWKERGIADPNIDSRMAGGVILGGLGQAGRLNLLDMAAREAAFDRLTKLFVKLLKP